MRSAWAASTYAIAGRIALGAILLLSAAIGEARGQDTASTAPCDGLPITAIDIQSNRPQFKGVFAWWRKFARSLGLHHETTQPGLIRRFVTLEPGDLCSEFRRTESERILRAQPYLSDAHVVTEPDGDGVRVTVSTVDEVPVLAGARVGGTQLRALDLGTLNFMGAGIHLEGRWEKHRERRQGFGAKIAHPQLFGRPYALVLDGMRRSLGEYYLATLSHPFYTDLQRIAWHSGYSVLKDYFPLRRSDETALLQPVDRWMWNVGGVIRLGPPRRLVLLGGMVLGEGVTPRHEFFLEDSVTAVLRPTTDTAGVRRYRPYDATHIAGVLGVRALTFSRMRGLDALVAEQDVGTGTQIAATAGLQPIWRDPLKQAFAALDVYVGGRTPTQFLAVRVEAESRVDIDQQELEHVVGSGRAAWYWHPRDRWTSELSIEGAGAWRTIFPFQLELGERRGGLRGHTRSYEAGGQRLLARLEERLDIGRYQRDRAAFGLAAFAEAGRMWAGDVPFGVNTPVRTSVGVALLGAVPAHSQRTLRAEVSVPLMKGPGAGTELRFTVREPARGFWFDPPRIRWARLSALPEQIFTWP